MTELVEHDDRVSDLTAEIADIFIANGTARMSLRDLAATLGTSARMLMHYFGTREALDRAALEHARTRQLQAANAALTKSTNVTTLLANTWRWYRAEDTGQYFALFTEVAAIENARPADDRQFGARLGAEWWPMFAPYFAADERYAKQARPLAQLLVATIRGLALDRHNGIAVARQKATFDSLTGLILR